MQLNFATFRFFVESPAESEHNENDNFISLNLEMEMNQSLPS